MLCAHPCGLICAARGASVAARWISALGAEVERAAAFLEFSLATWHGCSIAPARDCRNAKIFHFVEGEKINALCAMRKIAVAQQCEFVTVFSPKGFTPAENKNKTS
jgi:hypothetical protein